MGIYDVVIFADDNAGAYRKPTLSTFGVTPPLCNMSLPSLMYLTQPPPTDHRPPIGRPNQATESAHSCPSIYH